MRYLSYWLAGTLALMGALGVGCDHQEFYCGMPMLVDNTVVHRCNGPNEGCVCATNACARQVGTGTCKSRWIYLEEPFGKADVLADPKCVDDADSHSILVQTDDNLLCPLADAGVSNTAQSDGGTGGGGGATGGSSGGTNGTGGDAGSAEGGGSP